MRKRIPLHLYQKAYDKELAAAVPESNEKALADLRASCADWSLDMLYRLKASWADGKRNAKEILLHEPKRLALMTLIAEMEAK